MNSRDQPSAGFESPRKPESHQSPCRFPDVPALCLIVQPCTLGPGVPPVPKPCEFSGAELGSLRILIWRVRVLKLAELTRALGFSMRRDDTRVVEFAFALRTASRLVPLACLSTGAYIRNAERNRGEASHARRQNMQGPSWVQPETVLMLCHYITPVYTPRHTPITGSVMLPPF